MEQTVFLAGIDCGAGRGIASALLGRGWRVFAGRLTGGDLGELPARYPGRLTVLDMDVTSEASVSEAARTVARQAPALDMLVCNLDRRPAAADRRIADGQDYDEMLRTYDFIAGGAVRVTDAFQGLLEAGGMKRICAVTSEDGSNNLSTEADNYARAMSKAAANQMFHILFNRLRPQGYTFRLYCLGRKDEAGCAVEYFLQDRCWTAHEPFRSDDNRLVLRNRLARELPW